MSLNPCCHSHGHECRIVFSCAMAVVPCFVVVDLPVRKVFLLQAVHRIAEWLGPESAVLRGRTFLVWGVFVLFRALSFDACAVTRGQASVKEGAEASGGSSCDRVFCLTFSLAKELHTGHFQKFRVISKSSTPVRPASDTTSARQWPTIFASALND